MANITRTDIHRPSAIKPEEYAFVAFKYYGGSDLGAILAMQAQREILAAHKAQTGGKYSGHEHGGICHICGQGNISYACVFYHQPTNSYIVTGEDCAQKVDMSYGDMNAFRRAIHGALEAWAGKKKAEAILAEAGLSGCWAIYTADYDSLPGEERKIGDVWCQACGSVTVPTPGVRCADCQSSGRQPRKFKDVYREELTIRDIVGKLVKYGSISDKARNYLKTMLAKIATRPEREAAQLAQKEAAAPCPTGRVQITGLVLTVKVPEWANSAFPPSVKILVQDDRGFKVWGSCFANVQRGQRVKFIATVTPSQDDPKFGFYKRPAKGEIIPDNPEAVQRETTYSGIVA